MTPIALQDWLADHYQNGLHQAIFARDDLAALVGVDPMVIGTHRSKGLLLPVYDFTRNNQIRLVLRNNFHDWKLSASTYRDVGASGELSCLFHTTPPVEPNYTGDELASCYFEGFERADVYGYYSQDQANFSASVGGDYQLWAAVFAILRSLDLLKPQKWQTRLAGARARERA